ncbi:DUF1799 domain-containing protein [Megamonas sp.]|uniref:DUF1799 domain-containing protein n=1 Tax=Megamonas sp. TaxID=2049033 RepID=UPI00205E8023|nr:MAG TPA: protein of unknown function DUF1799 [Caudoviricetes sp.]DAF22528.1 MAG TPA: protein of unknown function DUF1799 [Caudoviricetes sp.]
MPENIRIWELWCACSTQWKYGFEGPVGLDYSAINIVAKNMDMELNPCDIKKLNAIETFTLNKIKNKPKKKPAKRRR